MLGTQVLEQVSQMAQEHGDLGLAAVVKILAVVRALDAQLGIPAIEGMLSKDLTAFIENLENTVQSENGVREILTQAVLDILMNPPSDDASDKDKSDYQNWLDTAGG